MHHENSHPRHESRIELDADIDQALANLRRTFPGICIWYGEFCGSLWALLPDRLAEAENAAGLARQLRAALSPPRPAEGVGRSPSPTRRRGRYLERSTPRDRPAVPGP
ncbi:hypothetical protein ACFHW2_06745 [Actinomadura sp. LOL_016]|uniref:hypothetical protein n=1 Tax=unclassified Actinomadura TaxID=2626254 RepID=UPI003A80A719